MSPYYSPCFPWSTQFHRPWSWHLYADISQVYFFTLDMVYNGISNCLWDILTLWIWTVSSTFYWTSSMFSLNICFLYVPCFTVHSMTAHQVLQKEIRMTLIILTSNESQNSHCISVTVTLLSTYWYNFPLVSLNWITTVNFCCICSFIYLQFIIHIETSTSVHHLKLKSSLVSVSWDCYKNCHNLGWIKQHKSLLS